MNDLLSSAVLLFTFRQDSKTKASSSPAPDSKSGATGARKPGYNPSQERGKDGRWVETNAESRDTTGESHKSFISKGAARSRKLDVELKLAKSPEAEVRAFQRFHKDLRDKGLPKEEADALANKVQLAQNLKTDSLSREDIKPLLSDFFQVTKGKGGKTLKSVRQSEFSYSYASKEFQTMALAKSAGDRSLMHEASHHVEFEDPKVQAASLDFLKSRSGNSEPMSLNEITGTKSFDANDVAYKGNFIHPYVGKVYPGRGTEVVSMGLQFFAKPQDMMALYKKDREHFNFVLGVID